jgi:hypothetical protein
MVRMETLSFHRARRVTLRRRERRVPQYLLQHLPLLRRCMPQFACRDRSSEGEMLPRWWISRLLDPVSSRKLLLVGQQSSAATVS